MASIYRPYVEHTAISFETEPPDEVEIARRMSFTLEKYPWLVCEVAGRVLGYARDRRGAELSWSRGARPAHHNTDIHATGGEPARVDRVKAFVPMQRGGTADDVARAILWLLSDEASYTTGAFLDVTGGK